MESKLCQLIQYFLLNLLKLKQVETVTKNNIEYGVWQCSNLGPLLSNIDLTDLFFECDDAEIASYVDDTPP